MIWDSRAQQFGFSVRIEEMRADQETIQPSCNVAGSDPFVAPSVGTIFWSDIWKAPLRYKVLQPFTKGENACSLY